MAVLDVPLPAGSCRAPAPRRQPEGRESLGVAGLEVRPLDPATDGERLRAMCPRVSAQSRYQRFFNGLRELSPPLLALLLDVDHRHREALVALEGDEIVAVARYAVNPADHSSADISLLVVDDLHRRGVARALLDRLETRAAERGVRALTATVLGENRQARGLLLAVHPESSARFERGTYTFRFGISRPACGAGAETSW